MGRLNKIVVVGILLGAVWPAWGRVDPAVIDAEVIDKVVTQPLRRGQNVLPEKVRHSVAGIETDLENMARSASTARSAARTAPMMSGRIAELESLRLEARTQLAAARARLVQLNRPAAIKDQDALAAKVEERFTRALKSLQAIDNSNSDVNRRAALVNAKRVLSGLRSPDDSLPVSKGPISTFTQDVPLKSQPQTPAGKPPQYISAPVFPGNMLAFNDVTLIAGTPPAVPVEVAQCSNYVAADLDKSATAQFEVRATPELTALADSLDYSPVKIFKWVYENIKYEPYYGSLKGAHATYLARGGNDTDQASLLISLLRISNIPARYVKGQTWVLDATPQTTNARIAKWLGVKGYAAAANLLSQGRNPSVGVVNNASAQAIGVSFTHVWVEACVAYGHYRGAKIDNAGHRWIPLDASFKDKTYQAGLAPTATFDYATYLSKRRNGPDSLPQEYYARQVETNIKNSFGQNFTLEDVPYRGTVAPLRVDVLPASLPFQVNQFLAWTGTTLADTAALPDAHRYKLNITVSNAANSPLATTTLQMPEHLLKRITLSPKGATTLDQTSLDAWRLDGSLATLAPSINVVPVINSDGAPVVVGATSVNLTTTDNQLKLEVWLPELGVTNCLIAGQGPGCVNAVNYTTIGAANYHALQAYGFQASDQHLANRAAKLLDSVKLTANPNTNLDETEGEYLNVVGLKYMRYITDANKSVGELDGGSGESGNHIGLTSSQMKVAYLFDLPFAVNRSGFLVDVPGGRSRNIDITTGALTYKTFLLSGYASSAYESYIWQENSRLDAVSTVRGIQFARETAIEVLTLTTANWSVAGDGATCANTASQCYKFTHNTNALLNYAAAEVSAIKANYIDQGFTLTIPRSRIQYDNWKGSVYVAEKNSLPTSAQAAYIISGSYAGGFTTGLPLIFNLNSILGTGFASAPTLPSIYANLLSGNPPYIIGGSGIGGGNSFLNAWAGDPVNMANGNMHHVERDISIPGRGGLPIVFERSYNSRAANTDTACAPMGCGWTHSFNHALKFYGVEGGAAKVSWIDGTGSEKFFSTTAHVSGNINLSATLTNPPGVYVTFTRAADGTYSIREKNGLTYKFETLTGGPTNTGLISKLQTITDRNANALTLTYTTGNLTAVRDALARGLDFTYTGARITQVKETANLLARTHQYTYEADGDLATYKNPAAVALAADAGPVTYAYYTAADGVKINHGMLSYTLPNSNGMKFEYYANGRTFRHSTLACATTPTAPTCQINTFTFNDFRREAVSVNERGFDRHFFFDEWGNPLKIVEENGAEHTYTYDTLSGKPYHRLTKKDPLGYVTGYAYDALGNVTTITTPRLATLTFGPFDPFNQPQVMKDARGNYTVMKYDVKGNLLEEIKLRAGALAPAAAYIPVIADVASWAINTYDTVTTPTGNLLTSKKVRDFATLAGPTVTLTYDASELFPTQISRLGDKTGDGLINASDPADVKTLAQDAAGRVTTGIDGDWHTTNFTYDTIDRVKTGTDAVGKTRSFSYDKNGSLIQNALTIAAVPYDRMQYSYDASDRRTSSTDFGSGITSTVYDVAGNPIKITNPDGFAITFQYDEANRAIRAMDQEGNQVFTHRDVDGRPKCSKDPNGNSVFYTYWDNTRDSKLRRVTAPSASPCPGLAPTTGVRAVEYDYDANGNVIQTTQIGNDGANTRTSFTTYDALNRPLQAIGLTYTDATLGSIRPVTQTTYNLLGVLTQVQAGQCTSALTGCAVAAVLTNQMTYLFDDFGRKLRETDALAKATSFLYDINNNVTQVTDAKAQITSFTWNYGHLMASRTNLAAGNVNLTYNNLGQVSQALTKVAASASVNLIQYDYTYDTFHRLDTLKDTRNAVVVDTLNYDFSPGGLLNKVTDGKLNQTNYLYDASGRLSGIWAPNYGTVSYRYDAGGRLKEKWLPNGVNSRYAYFTDNTLAQVVNRSLTASIISQHDYLYDAYANRRQQTSTITGSALTHGYTFDALDRLLTVKQTAPLDATKDETYTYDPLNNLKTRAIGTPVTATTAFVHDAANQLLEGRSGTEAGALLSGYVYDANGSLTKKCVGGTVTRTATDCTATGGAVTSLTYDTLDRMTQAVGTTTETYAYDQEGKRIRKVSGATTTNFHYMGPDIYAEYGTTFTAQNAITTHGPGNDDPILRQTGTGPTAIAKFYHQDGLGSVVAVSTATGTTDGTQRFDAWGNKTTVTGTAVATYGYTGREPDASGLTYYRARYYDPASRRFTQRDPIGFGGGDINLYAYVGNNPTNFTDPDGQTPLHAAAGLVGGGLGLLFQVGSDLIRGQLSSPADYAGAVVGGAAGGVAAVTCGPACAGAIAGAASNLTTQAIRGNGFSGTSLAVDTAMGAAGGKIVGALLPPAAKAHLTTQTKGAIGEGLSELGLLATGQSIARTPVRNGVGKSTFDFELASGKFVESKFGTSKLSGPQRTAAQQQGSNLEAHYWNYDRISGIAASGPAAALGFGSDAGNYFSSLYGIAGSGKQTISGISPH